MRGVTHVGRVLPEEPYATLESRYSSSVSSKRPIRLFFVKGGAYRKTVVPEDYSIFYVNLSETDAIRGQFCRKGKAENFIAGPGQLVGIVPAHEEQIFQLDDDYWQAVLCIPQSILNDKITAISLGEYDRAEVVPAYAVDSPFLFSTLREMENEWCGRALADRLYLEALYDVVMTKIAARYTTMNKELPSFKMHSPAQIRKVLDYIFGNLDQDVKLTSLAAMMDLKPYHFLRIFKEYLGASPYQYIMNLRLEKAKEFLKNTDLSLVAIASALGFSSEPHFQHYFTERAGLAPLQYREANLHCH